MESEELSTSNRSFHNPSPMNPLHEDEILALEQVNEMLHRFVGLELPNFDQSLLRARYPDLGGPMGCSEFHSGATQAGTETVIKETSY